MRFQTNASVQNRSPTTTGNGYFSRILVLKTSAKSPVIPYLYLISNAFVSIIVSCQPVDTESPLT